MLLCSAIVSAQTQTSNMDRAWEAYNNGDMDAAVRYFELATKDAPDDGFAYVCLGTAKQTNGDLQGAITTFTTALVKLKPDEAELRTSAYEGRAQVYYNMDKPDAALADLNQALKLTQDPEQTYRLYYFRAHIYNGQEKYDLSAADFRKMLELNKSIPDGYLGLGTVALNKKQTSEALSYFNQAIAIAPDYTYCYSSRAMCYADMQKYALSAADLVKAIDLSKENRDATAYLIALAEVAPNEVLSALKKQKAIQPKEIAWSYILAIAANIAGNQREVISACKDLEANGKADVSVFGFLVHGYTELGLYDKAIEYSDKLMELSGDKSFLANKSQLEDYAGRSADAMRDINESIRLFPDFGWSYYWRGWMKEHANDYDGALSDYSLAIEKAPDYAYSYMCRGRLYQLRGETKKAEADLREAIRLEPDPEKATCAQYAYLYLGQKDKAVEVMNAILKTNDKFYDAACLFSEVGDKTKALTYLRKSLEAGFCRFSHMEHDHSLDNIRTTAEYKQMVSEFKKKYEAEKAKDI